MDKRDGSYVGGTEGKGSGGGHETKNSGEVREMGAMEETLPLPEARKGQRWCIFGALPDSNDKAGLRASNEGFRALWSGIWDDKPKSNESD